MSVPRPSETLLAAAPVRPHLRGRLHQVALVGSIVGLVWLVREADGWQAAVSAWVYGVSGVLLYLTSSSYHVFARSLKVRRIMRRADHSMIFVLIAGSFTPVCILGLHGWQRWPLLAAVWAGAATGIVLKITAMERFPKLGSALYIVLGWAGLAAFPALADHPGRLALVVAAGLLYTGGAILFALRWPKFWPTWFGYHEVWHLLGTTAGVLLFVVNLGLVREASG